MKRNRADGEDEDDHQVKKPHLTSDTIVVPSSLLTKVFEYLPSTTLAKCSRVSFATYTTDVQKGIQRMEADC